MRRLNSVFHAARVRVGRAVARFVAIAAASLPSAGA